MTFAMKQAQAKTGKQPQQTNQTSSHNEAILGFAAPGDCEPTTL